MFPAGKDTPVRKPISNPWLDDQGSPARAGGLPATTNTSAARAMGLGVPVMRAPPFEAEDATPLARGAVASVAVPVGGGEDLPPRVQAAGRREAQHAERPATHFLPRTLQALDGHPVNLERVGAIAPGLHQQRPDGVLR